MSRTSITALLLTLLCAPAIAQLTMQATPEQVSSAINARGANAVLQSLRQEEAVFDSLLFHVERGEQEWFGIWLKLRPFVDGGQSESIDIAFARAIPHAPAAILKLIGNGLELRSVCTSPFIEPDPGVAEQYEVAAIKALSSVPDKDLQVVKQQCIRRVQLPNTKS